MSVFDLLRSQNSIEHAPEPDLAPEQPPASPGGTVPGASPALPTAGPVAGPSAAPAIASPAKADPPGVQAQYYIESVGKERRYYKDLAGKQLAFRADAKAVTTKQEDKATVSHMLDVAQSRGWTSLHVRGTAAFKQEAWIEAQARGLAVKGYEPTADDRRDLAARRVAREKNAEAEPSAPVQQAPQENTIANAAQPQQQVQTIQPTQPTAPVSAPTPTTSAPAQQVANGPEESQAKERRQRPSRKPASEAKPVATDADAGQPVERKDEAKREPPVAPAAKAADNSNQQQYPRHAREPWMDQTGGYAALSPAQRASAERSHERWIAAGKAERPHTMGLEEYVGHVQGKQAEAREKQARLEAKAHTGTERGKAEPVSAASATVGKGAAENGPAEAVQLSPAARKVLTFLERQIETQMANLTDDVKADLRAHAAQAIAKREGEGGPVRLPAVKANRTQQAERDQAVETPKRKARGDEDGQKPMQVQQPRMSMG